MKRLFDIAVSLVSLAILFPFFLACGLLILATMGRPVFFVQTRSGKDGQPFRMVKFRTMSISKDIEITEQPDSERLTKLGRVLRASSLDELPELWNVLKGDMSLVGPRPLLIEYLHLYSAEQFRRHEIRPGITGWAQINGRNSISWQEKFAFDVWYVDHQSFHLDLKILLLTFKRVLQRRGINADGEATVSKFNGDN